VNRISYVSSFGHLFLFHITHYHFFSVFNYIRCSKSLLTQVFVMTFFHNDHQDDYHRNDNDNDNNNTSNIVHFSLGSV